MIVGMINLLITISTAEGGFALLLEDLVVHRDHRGRGLGTRLLQHAKAYAREKNFLRITLLMDPNERLLGFYRRQGFVDSSLHPMRCLPFYES
jgi:GNAT superfamily N-acetyltransferase